MSQAMQRVISAMIHQSHWHRDVEGEGDGRCKGTVTASMKVRMQIWEYIDQRKKHDDDDDITTTTPILFS